MTGNTSDKMAQGDHQVPLPEYHISPTPQHHALPPPTLPVLQEDRLAPPRSGPSPAPTISTVSSKGEGSHLNIGSFDNFSLAPFSQWQTAEDLLAHGQASGRTGNPARPSQSSNPFASEAQRAPVHDEDMGDPSTQIYPSSRAFYQQGHANRYGGGPNRQASWSDRFSMSGEAFVGRMKILTRASMSNPSVSEEGDPYARHSRGSSSSSKTLMGSFSDHKFLPQTNEPATAPTLSVIQPHSFDEHPTPAERLSTSFQYTPIKPSLPLGNDVASWITNRFAPDFNTDAAFSLGAGPPPFEGSGAAFDPYLVDFLPSEPANPYNWRKSYRWLLTVYLALTVLCPVFISTSYVASIESLQLRFRVSTELALGGLSLYMIGIAAGPLVWAPLSELIGRRYAFLLSFPFFVLFNLGSAVSQNIGGVLVTRFFAGVMGSAQLANVGGQVADLWRPADRVTPGAICALSPLLGPVLGPMISGFLAENHGFRAVFWLQFAFALVMLVSWIFLLPETYGPTLLGRKARLLQNLANDLGTGENFISKFAKDQKPVREHIKVGMLRPFELLFKEVICFTLSLWLALVYGTLYLLFPSYSIIFQVNRGWSLGLTGLALIGIGIGQIIGFILCKINVRAYAKAVATLPKGVAPPPEVRLPGMILGAALVPVGLIIFAWTAPTNVPWIICILASVIFGAGYLLVFVSVLLYLVDSYTVYAASALAANTVMRCIFGAVFPLFSTQMINNIGIGWTGTILAFLALACAPLPFLFYRYGPYLRRNSRYIPSTLQTSNLSVNNKIDPENQGDRAPNDMETISSPLLDDDEMNEKRVGPRIGANSIQQRS